MLEGHMLLPLSLPPSEQWREHPSRTRHARRGGNHGICGREASDSPLRRPRPDAGVSGLTYCHSPNLYESS